MNIDIRYSRFDGRAVEGNFSTSSIIDIQNILEKFNDEFNKANGHIEAYIKDDLGNVSMTIECEDSDLKARMYQALKPYIQ
jgi:hypothetical protein